MAVVFISPKQKQKTFFLGITAVFILFLAGIALGVFLSQPNEGQSQLVFNKPKISINFKTLDSGQFKNLEPFTNMELQFAYSAKAEDGKSINGFISAVSAEEARKILESMNLSTIDIKEANIGRDNPFIPYY